MTRALAAAVLGLGLTATQAAAQAYEAREPPAPPPDVRGVAQQTAPQAPLLLVPRVLLAPLWLAFRTTTELLLLAPRLEDDQHVRQRVGDVLFDDTRTYGLYPTAFYETGLSPNLGLRFVHRDLLEQRERLQLRAGFGGLRDQVYEAQGHSGERFGRVRVSGRLRYRADELSFFGVGNADEGGVAQARATLSAIDPEVAVEARYRSEELRSVFGGALALGGPLRLTLVQRLRARRLSIGEGLGAPRWVTEVYTGRSLRGFERDLVDGYSELSLRYDDRRRARADLPRVLPSSGLLVASWAGIQRELAEPETTFGRVGLDVQPFIDLYRGNRVLRLRLRGSWLIGELERIAFVDLPALGGAQLLRGHPRGRFRGRGTLLAVAEYRYPVQENVAGYLFVDAGRAFTGIEEVTVATLGNPRVGFGGGLFVHTTTKALFRVQLATSLDGGAFFALRLDTTDDAS